MSAKILVADESPTIHKIVAMAFEDRGITVEGISRGEHALEYMKEFQPDIVLVDIHLPETNGYELCRQIKNSSSFDNIRVILLTSDFEDIDQTELEISRADDFISKPFKTEEILKKVNSQLKLPEPVKEATSKNPEPSSGSENNEVIQNEFDDIVNQPKESTPDSVKQLFDDDEDTSSIKEIVLEADTPSEPKKEDSREEKPDVTKEDIHTETRSLKVKSDDLNSVFQSVLSAPKPELEDAPKPEPGTRPNLIDETLSFMAKQRIEEEIETVSTPEPLSGETPHPSGNSASQSPGDKIIKEHMDQVMDRLPEGAMQGKSHAALEKTVREVLGEVAPKIIQKVIREEIETIKKMKEA